MCSNKGVETYVINDPGAETIEIDRWRADGTHVSENVTGELRVRACRDGNLQIDMAAIFRR